MPLRSPDDREADGEGEEKKGDHAQDPPADRWGRERAGGDDGHGEPPFGEHPGGPLPQVRGLPDDVISVVGPSPGRELGQEVGQVVLEASIARHAGCPPGADAGPATGSRTTVARIETSA